MFIPATDDVDAFLAGAMLSILMSTPVLHQVDGMFCKHRKYTAKALPSNVHIKYESWLNGKTGRLMEKLKSGSGWIW
jgi:hypothetical protein